LGSSKPGFRRTQSQTLNSPRKDRTLRTPGNIAITVGNLENITQNPASGLGCSGKPGFRHTSPSSPSIGGSPARGWGLGFTDLYSSQFENNFFTEICSGSEAGSYLRLIDFVYHSTLGSRVTKKKEVLEGRVQDSGFRFRGFGFRVQGLGCGFQGLGKRNVEVGRKARPLTRCGLLHVLGAKIPQRNWNWSRFGLLKSERAWHWSRFLSFGEDAGAVRCPMENVYTVSLSPRRGLREAVITRSTKLKSAPASLPQPSPGASTNTGGGRPDF